MKLTKHDAYVKELCEQIQHRYDSLDTHVHLISERTKREVGEIDVVARKGDRVDLYEVKCSYRIHKAKRQLKKFSRIMSKEQNVGENFFYCGLSGIIELVV